MPTQLFRDFRRPQSNSVPLGPFTQGVNEKSEPHLLEFSELSDASNVVIDETNGRLKKRLGTLFKATIPYLVDPPKRAYDFVRRDGVEILLITDDKKLVTTQDLVTFHDITPVLFLAGSQFAGGAFTLQFETAEDRVWVTNGSDPVFSWDGSIGSPSTQSLIAYDLGTAEITLGAGDTNTQISDPLLDRAANGTTWVGQLLVVTDAADPTIIGRIARITVFDDALDKITFPAITGLAIGDKVLIGVAIPRGRILRFHFGTMFLGATVDNLSEIRFTDTVDPNEPQITIGIENPNAWPAKLQIDLGGGDRLWGFSPIMRDRFCTFKAGGLIRIDPDPTFRFTPTVISSQIGSRFPDTWRQHGNILMFLGQDLDGLPDVYMTNFTEVDHFNRKHFKTLDNLKQANSIFRASSLTAKSDFDAGTESSMVDTDFSAVQQRILDSLEEYRDVLRSASNVDMESEPGRVGLLGTVVGGVKYNATVLPTAATPPWTSQRNNVTQTIVVDKLNTVATANFNSYSFYRQRDVLDSTKDSLLHVRARVFNADVAAMAFGLWNGAKGVVVEVIFRTLLSDELKVNNVTVLTTNFADNMRDYVLLLKADGTFKFWLDGVLKKSGTALATSFNKVQFGTGSRVANPMTNDTAFNMSGLNQAAQWDEVNFSPTYKGDSLDSQGGKVAPIALPDTLPLAGNVIFEIDQKKAIETNPTSYRYGKYIFETELNGQTLLLETSAENRAGASLAGYATITDGQEPGIDNATPKGQRLLLRASFTNLLPGMGAEIKRFSGGFLYLTPAITIGAEIKRWESLQRTLLAAFPQLDIKVRRSTSASLLADAVSEPDPIDETGWLRDMIGAFGNPTDADGFVGISDGQNIGTVFGGAEDTPNPPFPDARHVQVLLSGHVNDFAGALADGVDSLLINWVEGSPEILPTMAVILKKKWLLIAATLDSTFNNIVVTVDGNRSFVNWSGIDSNFLIWFRGNLYAGNAVRKEILVMQEDLRDDDGPDGFGGRLVKAISAFIETKQEIGGEIHERKKADAINVMADNDVTTEITVKTRRDEETDFTQVGPALAFSPADTHKRIRCPLGLQFKRITLRAENSRLDEDLPLEGFVFDFSRVPGRRGT